MNAIVFGRKINRVAKDMKSDAIKPVRTKAERGFSIAFEEVDSYMVENGYINEICFREVEEKLDVIDAETVRRNKKY
jgi:hypothetical protein